MKIYIKKLGCPKNDVDADYLAGAIIKAGHELADNPDKADVVVVNSCGFILPAKEESIEEILRFEDRKSKGQLKKIIVTGCLSQRYGDELKREFSNIDGFLGIGQDKELLNLLSSNEDRINRPTAIQAKYMDYIAGENRNIDSEFPYAYLKISDGCDRFCSYCAIPHIRGRFRSRDMQSILDEANQLAQAGKKEIILVSQEGTAYGRDFPDDVNISTLLRKIEEIESVEWIRLMYMHPESVSNELIELMTHSDKILGYFDMPLQHINDKVLKGINRPYTKKDVVKVIEKIRAESLSNVIRTTFIAGLPGETEQAYEELEDFISEVKFDRLGVFSYSPEDGTPAARSPDQIPSKIAAERQDLLMSLQQEIAFKKNMALIGSRQKVIIDRIRSEGNALGRTPGDCPDIDQIVYVSGRGLEVGQFPEVEITMAEGYDMVAKVV